MPYRYSENGKKLTEFYEGRKNQAYQDGGGIWTIGVGHAIGVKAGDGLTDDQVENIFSQDIITCEGQLNDLHLKINQQQFDALIDFIFEFGIGRFSTSTLFKEIRLNPNDPDIKNQFMRWTHGSENGAMVELDELVRRRMSDADMYFTGALNLYSYVKK